MDLTDKILEMSIVETSSNSPTNVKTATNTISTTPTIVTAANTTTTINNGGPNDLQYISKNGSDYQQSNPSSTSSFRNSNFTSASSNRMSHLLEDVKSHDSLDIQSQRLKQLVEQISSQEAKLIRLKSLLKQAKEQSAINSELNNELKSVNRTIDEKDGELRFALNRIDNLNRQLTSHRRSRAYRNSKGSCTSLENKSNLSNGRRVSFDPLALLLDAAFEGELDLVIQTSKQVTDLSASHEECVTALHNAAVAGHYEIAKYLIDAGCDVNIQDCDGWTPLHCASSCNHLPLIKLLIENGALIYATTTTDHVTPAMKCEESIEGFEDCYNYLIQVQNNLGVINDGVVYALYDYEAQQEDELSFVTYEELIILRRGDSQEEEWWWARKKTSSNGEKSKEGYIPRNMVGLCPRAAAFKKTKRFININMKNNNANTIPN